MNLRFTICDLRLGRYAFWFMFLGLHLMVGLLQAQPSNALPELVPAYPEIQPTFWGQHKAGVVIGAIALTLLAAFVLWSLFHSKPGVALPPEKIAREALTKLLNEPEDGNVLSAVSQVLRRYISQRFNLPDGELTTAEFARNLAQADNIGLELGKTLCSFLRECDVRKFSPANAVAPLDAARRALELVEQADRQRQVLEDTSHD